MRRSFKGAAVIAWFSNYRQGALFVLGKPWRVHAGKLVSGSPTSYYTPWLFLLPTLIHWRAIILFVYYARTWKIIGRCRRTHCLHRFDALVRHRSRLVWPFTRRY